MKKTVLTMVAMATMMTTAQAEIASNTTIYEDGTKASSWEVYDNSPAIAGVFNVIDTDPKNDAVNIDRNSTYFCGMGTMNGFRLGGHLNSSKSWKNTKEFTIFWAMKTGVDYVVYVDVTTTKGHRYLTYTNSDGLHWGNGCGAKYIYHGLGSYTTSNVWFNFERDLEADLHDEEPDNKILQVNGFLLRGQAYIGTVQLHKTPVAGTGAALFPELHNMDAESLSPNSDYDNFDKSNKWQRTLTRVHGIRRDNGDEFIYYHRNGANFKAVHYYTTELKEAMSQGTVKSVRSRKVSCSETAIWDTTMWNKTINITESYLNTPNGNDNINHVVKVVHSLNRNTMTEVTKYYITLEDFTACNVHGVDSIMPMKVRQAYASGVETALRAYTMNYDPARDVDCEDLEKFKD